MPAVLRAWTAEQRVRCALASVAGLLFGLSAFWSGFYQRALWSPATLALLAVALALVIAAPERPTGLATVFVGGLAGLWLWALLSRRWADRADLALVEANRWVLYTVVALTLVLIIGHDRRAAGAVLGACSAAALTITAYALVRMLLPDAKGLFLGVMLNAPIGYSNGEANLFLLGLWPLLAVAEDIRRPGRSTLAIVGATALGGLLFAAQRRGSIVAIVVSGLVLFALVPGRRVRLWALLAVLGGVGLASRSIAPLFEHPDASGVATVRDAHRAAIGALVAAVVVGAVWRFVLAVVARVRARGAAERALARASTAGLLALALALFTAGALNADELRHRISVQYDEFVHLAPPPGSLRFLSGGGNRYDYWRVAWREFRDEPLRGVGAGNYTVGYFRDRRTIENIRQPHSIELQILAELGLVGALFLGVFVVAPIVGLARWSRQATQPGAERLIAVGAGGLFLAWLAQTSVDWMHLIPSITALALGAGAVLCAPPRVARPAVVNASRPPHARLLRPAMLLLVSLAIALAALSTARMMLADHLRAQATALLVRNPLAALSKTNDALGVEGDSADTYYVRAAALARLHDYDGARAALRSAIAHGRDDWVSWALLGDLAVRRRDLLSAAAAYARARELNPRAAGLTVPPMT